MNTAGVKEVTESLAKVYGPFAFGVISLLVIWYSIISPELNRKQLDFENYSSLIKAHQEQNIQQGQTAQTLRDTALILDRVSARLEKINVP